VAELHYLHTERTPQQRIAELICAVCPPQAPQNDMITLLHTTRTVAACIGSAARQPEQVSILALALCELLALAERQAA
jgi:hypothetical protein